MASTSGATNNVTGYLRKIIGNSVGKLIPLTSDGGEIAIGRNQMAVQIWIENNNISRVHCILKYRENGWFIKDLKSVNGVFLDETRIEPNAFYPLKNGVGIYLGPPDVAPAAFIFLSELPNELSHERNLQRNRQRFRGEITGLPNLDACKSIKRPSDLEDSGTNENILSRKRIAISSSPTTPSSRVQDVLEEMENNGNLSDCSISSLDSLRTRIRKRSAKKKMDRNSRNKDSMNAASTSASPQLRPPSNTYFDNQPSTSAAPSEILDRRKNINQKPTISKEFALLNTFFNESDSSTPETLKGEDSQSLLNDSKILIDCEPYPFSQPLATEAAEKKSKTKKDILETEKENSVDEELQKATLKIERLKKDKLYLSRLVKDLKSDQKTRQEEFHKFLEDELICNICTEIFIKAITLGCSHTFCEKCITEWKKKKKQCPICREKITSETKILVLDSFINKAVERLDTETQDRWKKLASDREKLKATQQKKGKRSGGRGRNRRIIQSESSDADEVRQTRGESSNGVGVQIRFSSNSSNPSIQVLPLEDEFNESDDEDFFVDIGSGFSDLSDGSDMSVEGYGYFGGYGRCYSCGRRGHWANGCPYV